MGERTIIGVDPGLSGAIARLRPGDDLTVWDLPTLRIGKRTVLDHYGLARIFDDLVDSDEAATVWLEFVSSSPQMGVASSFKFGQGYGMIIGVAAAHFFPMEFVTPPQWKSAMKCRGDKDESRARASALFPTQSRLFARVKDNGRSDAALIALYGARQAVKEAA